MSGIDPSEMSEKARKISEIGRAMEDSGNAMSNAGRSMTIGCTIPIIIGIVLIFLFL